jgi:predicted RNase H-like HicB family nuclease
MSDLANVLNQQSVQVRLWEEDGGYLAECVDIPGCMSQGDTRSEAMINIMNAIATCLEVIAEDAGADLRKSATPDLVELSIDAVLCSR